MARLPLNKTSLTRLTGQLRLYEEHLPSLDLKRRQLIQERNSARSTLQTLQEQSDTLPHRVAEELPMLAIPRIDLTGLVRVTRVALSEENLVGVRLPVLGEIHYAVSNYTLMATPHWIEQLVALLKEALSIRISLQIARERLHCLETAVRTTTQRVNLFERVLIPQTREAIRRIVIALSDAERAGVVRAKIAKSKREATA
ncbi:MAG: V-type ATP synthase subunit D [Magnetococcales bacterium]|nr:V-type ATP synthase subunit D [Magnetococcales bacterium]